MTSIAIEEAERVIDALADHSGGCIDGVPGTGHHDVWQPAESMIGGKRLLGKNIRSGALQMTALKRSRACRIINEFAARDVDEDRARASSARTQPCQGS